MANSTSKNIWIDREMILSSALNFESSHSVLFYAYIMQGDNNMVNLKEENDKFEL